MYLEGNCKNFLSLPFNLLYAQVDINLSAVWPYLSFFLNTRAINLMMSILYSKYLRDEQTCSYNSNNKETKKILILFLRPEVLGSKEQFTLIKGILWQRCSLNMCLIYTSHKSISVHPCILVHKHTDILSTAQDMRNLKKKVKYIVSFSRSSPSLLLR